jgi:membrane protein implicated in regulation of membrane protease activity
MVAANLLGLLLRWAVPEGSSGWTYLLVASAACAVAFAWVGRRRADREESR